MSALGQKRTSVSRFAMATLPSKADVVGAQWAKRNCKPKCKPTARQSMVLGMTYRDRERMIAERVYTLSYWPVQVGTTVLELKNRKRHHGIDTITGTLSCRLGKTAFVLELCGDAGAPRYQGRVPRSNVGPI